MKTESQARSNVAPAVNTSQSQKQWETSPHFDTFLELEDAVNQARSLITIYSELLEKGWTGKTDGGYTYEVAAGAWSLSFGVIRKLEDSFNKAWDFWAETERERKSGSANQRSS